MKSIRINSDFGIKPFAGGHCEMDKEYYDTLAWGDVNAPNS